MNTNSTQTSNSILSEKYFCGIDLASKVIQVSVTRPNEESYDLSLKIKDFDEFIKKHCSDNYIYAMEACGNSNYWADKIAKQGGAVYIFPAQKCRSYNHGCKDDRGDARGVRDLLLTYIASPEAATVHPCVIRDRQSRADMEMVKSYGDIQSDLTTYLRRLIAFLKEQDATLCYSYSMSPEETIRKANEYTVKLNAEDADVNFSLITDIQDQCAIITLILKRRQNIYAAFSRYLDKHPECRYLMAVPGSGLLLAAISHIVTQGDFKRFKNPRAFAAYTGFVPEHSGTGGKNRIKGLSEKGNPVLKALLYEGANACISHNGKQNKKDKREKIKLAGEIARSLWKIGINLNSPDEIKEILQHYDPDLASKITEKNFNSKLSKFKSKCNKLALLLERLTSSPVITDWLKSNSPENENSSFSPDLEKFKDCPIDLSSEDSPFRRSVARLKAYFKGLNDIPEQKLSDGELLDDVPVSFQMN